MKIRILLALFCILTLLLTFTACKPPVSVDSTSNTTEANIIPTSADPTKTTSQDEASGQDLLTLEQGYPFIYYGTQFLVEGLKIDQTNLNKGGLYVHNKTTGENYLLSDSPVISFAAFATCVYYINTDSSEVIRCDLTGHGKTSVYRSEGKLTWVSHFYDGSTYGKLLVVENHKKAILVDLKSNSQTLLMEQYHIDEAYYENNSKAYTKENKGSTIMWRGSPIEKGRFTEYLYFVNTKELLYKISLGKVDIAAQFSDEESLSERYFPFIFNGRQIYVHGPEVDISMFTDDRLYSHDQYSNVFYLLADTEVAQMDTTREYIYYRPADNSRIVRSDYTGEEQTVIYTSEKEITWFDYSADKLLIVENKKKMVLIDLATGTSEEITEQFCINEAFYFPDASDFTSEDKGQTIQWYGHSTETDELSCYIYHIDKNEMYVPTWH